MEIKKLKAAVEALLFVADEPLSLRRIAAICEAEKNIIEKAIAMLRQDYAGEERGLQLIEVAGGYKLGTKRELADYIERYIKPSGSHGLSKAALETLAIVAYKQPITRLEIEMIRGVKSDSALNTLMERKMIEEVGRKDAIGRPILYGTTKEFLRYFGLKSIKDLPQENFIQLEEFKESV